jgi:hypothetical protein
MNRIPVENNDGYATADLDSGGWDLPFSNETRTLDVAVSASDCLHGMAPAGQKRPVGEIASLEIECGDCGRLRVWTGRELAKARVPRHVALQRLGGRLFCSWCRAQGGAGTNVEIRPSWRSAGRRAYASLDPTMR